MGEDENTEMTLFDPSVGDLSLAFVDTVNWRGRDEPEEMLHTCLDLITWSREAGLVDAPQAEILAALAQANPRQAQGVFAEALLLREALYRMISALIAGQTPLPADMQRFNAALGSALSQRQIQADGAHSHWAWRPTAFLLDGLLSPVLLAAAELLVSEEFTRIRACGNDECGWLFIDRSRNRSRKWCSSESCGNRIRVRQFYSRSRGS
jgi:predicted RNA-binding Zn ribbon-like protein